MLQSAALIISFVVMPAEAAEDAEAPLVEWALKMDTSIPALSRVVLSQRAIEADVTAWCGFIHEMNSCEVFCLPSGWRSASVLSIYWFIVVTGQMEELGVNRAKKNSWCGLLGLACFVRPAGEKVIPSRLCRQRFTSNRRRSADLLGRVS